MASALRNTTRSGSPIRRVLIWSLLVFIVFSCLAILLTYPLVSNLSHDYFNPTTPHDGVGTIASYWYKDYARQHGLSGTRTTFWSYPWGYDLHDLADPLSGGVLGLASSALGPQVAFNILMILSFCLVIIALFAIDVTVVPPLRAKDITKVPKAVTDLARYPKSEPVIYYPMVGQYFIPLQYRYYQTFNEHPMLNGIATGTIGDFYQGVLKDIYAPYTPHMLSGLGIKKAVVIPALYKLILPVGIDFDPRMMPPGYKLLEKASDSYIYEITASPATLFPLYYTNFSGSVVLEDGKAWNALLSPSGEVLIQNKGGPATADFSITVNNPDKEGTLSMDLDGTPLGSTRIAAGEGTVKVPLKLEGKEQTLTFRWDGRPVAENGKVVGLTGNIQVYLFLTRPQFNQTGL